MSAAVLEEPEVEKSSDFELRRATPADRDALLTMYRSFEPAAGCLGLPPRSPEAWLDGLAVYTNFIALAESRVVGHAVLCPGGDSGEVAVFVHQDYRRRRLGRRLLTALIEEARRLGLRRVWGMTEIDNVPLIRLNLSLGFVPGDDPHEFYLDLGVPVASTGS